MFTDADFGSPGALYLAEALKANSTLKSFQVAGQHSFSSYDQSHLAFNGIMQLFSGNIVGVTGACALAEAFQLNIALTSLTVCGTFIDVDSLVPFDNILHHSNRHWSRRHTCFG